MGVIMTIHNAPQFAGTSATTTSRAYVIYDRETGDISHIHHVVELLAGDSTAEEHKAHAFRMAGARAGANSDLLEVDSSEVNTVKPIGVDPTKRAIVGRPAKSR